MLKLSRSKKILAGLGLLALSLVVRWPLFSRDLPYYEIDENDIVEPALAFLSGDWEPYRYQYGPVYAYLLMLVYRLLALVSGVFPGWDRGDLFYHAFFDPTIFYALARASHTVIICAIAWVMYRFAARYFGPRESLVALALGLAPLLDLTTEPGFTLRIDTLMALFCTLSLYYSARFGDEYGGWSAVAAAGFFAGLAIATKPLGGILLLPALLVTGFLAIEPGAGSLDKRALIYLRRKDPWKMIGFTFAGAVIGNPYSLVRLGQFTQQQIDVIMGRATRIGFFRGYDIRWFFEVWGWPFAIAILAAVIFAFWQRDRTSKTLLPFIVIFFIAFTPFAGRTYWYSPIVPALCLLVSRMVVRAADLQFFSTRKIPAALLIAAQVVILIFYPWYQLAAGVRHTVHPEPSLARRADYAAQRWIETNIPSESKILAVGWYSINLPRLVAVGARAQGRWGEHFMYMRGRSATWVAEFNNAYGRYHNEGRPKYKVVNLRSHYENNPDFSSEIRGMVRDLKGVALEIGVGYIVTASPSGYTGPWEKDPGVKLLASFSPDEGYLNHEVKIFSLR